MRIHQVTKKTGITRTKEFEKKLLAQYAVNPGMKCDHDCLYCSTGAMLRTHKAFRDVQESPFEVGYGIIDPDAPERVAHDARTMKKRGLIQLCTTVDAWSPASQKFGLGRKCLEAILSESEWSVRILTKNAAIRNDFNLIKQHRDRILVGLSITATPDKSDIIEIIEPHASPLKERMLAIVDASAQKLRTYGMLCPLLPGIADSPEHIEQLVKFATECNVEEIFVEPVNQRGKGLIHCQEALKLWGYDKEAEAINRIRNQANWSKYVVDLLTHTQRSIRKHFDINKLRFLLYPSRLLPEDLVTIKQDDAGVVWL